MPYKLNYLKPCCAGSSFIDRIKYECFSFSKKPYAIMVFLLRKDKIESGDYLSLM